MRVPWHARVVRLPRPAPRHFVPAWPGVSSAAFPGSPMRSDSPPSPTAAAKPGKRARKADLTRRALFAAAARVVGRKGYENASIAEITRLAGVANGTFYNYFTTRQELFDELLLVVGEQLLAHIRAGVAPDAAGLGREQQRIAAYFDFFQRNPGFLRILSEAEVFAPKAFRKHMQQVAQTYTQSLLRHHARGDFPAYDARDLEALVHILLGARHYIAMSWGANARRSREEAERHTAVYLKLLSSGLFTPEATGATRSARRRTSPAQAPAREPAAKRAAEHPAPKHAAPKASGAGARKSSAARS